MSRGSPTRGQTTRDKDSKPVSPNQSINQSGESACFGSSGHYGGRDFYVHSPSDQISGAPKSVKTNEGKGTNQATQTLPLEVNGDKVPNTFINFIQVFGSKRSKLTNFFFCQFLICFSGSLYY
ncbi:hypothetical protein BHE74_00032485 [Ensete ventricosum]|nr:hypothetical protein BHE74_00032485 [Ensete ventricosum]